MLYPDDSLHGDPIIHMVTKIVHWNYNLLLPDLAKIAQNAAQRCEHVANRCLCMYLCSTGACRLRSRYRLVRCAQFPLKVSACWYWFHCRLCVCACLCARAGDPRKNNTSFRVQFFARSDFAQMRVSLPFGGRPQLPDTVPCIRAGTAIRCPPLVSDVS